MKRLFTRALRGVFVIGLLVVVVTLSYGTHAESVDPDQLLKHFETIAFGSEYDVVAPVGHVQKWMSPVRVSIVNMEGKIIPKAGGGKELKLNYAKPTPKQVSLIKKHLKTLVTLTGIKSEKANKDAGKPANFIIKFVPRLVMGQPFIAKDVPANIIAKLGKAGVCYFLTRSISTGAMFRSLIIVNSELPRDQMNACLLEEMTQALGLPNDSDVVSPSIFNQKSVNQELSKADVMLIKTLYDKRLPAGTPKADALRIGRQIISEKLGSQ